MPRSTGEKTKIAKRRQDVAQMYLSGKYQSEIAEYFGVTQRTISNDLKASRKEWIKNAALSIEEVVSRELTRIDALELKYQTAFDRSCILNSKEVDEEGNITKSPGDPRFLAGLQWCVEQRLKIYGGYAPQKAEVSDMRTPDLSSLTFEQLYELKHGHKPRTDD